jgi:sugar lactone lactonase YvrE
VPGARRVGDALVAEVSHFSFFVTASTTRPTRAIVGDGWAVREIDLADGGVRTLVDGMPERSYLTAVAVDEQGRVYWLDNVTDALTRIEADGSGRQVLYTSPDAFSNPEGLAVDSARGLMFWAEGGKVMRAQLDGSGAGPFIAVANNAYATSVALDPLGGFVYWTDNGTDTINRVAYDGSARTVLHSTPNLFGNPRALAVDVAAGLMFWGEGFGLLSAPLDGGAVTTLSAGTVDFTSVTGVALDPDARQLYWTDNGTDALTRANYDGTGQVRVYSSPVWSPGGPLDAGPGVGNATNPQGVALK